MRLGQEIEMVRKKKGLSVVDMCNIFETDENGYYDIVRGKIKPSIFQLIMFIDSTHYPLDTLEKQFK